MGKQRNESMKNPKQSNLVSYSLGLFRQLELDSPDVTPMMPVISIKQTWGTVVFLSKNTWLG